jgi:SNF2 family DNA or RNA helicase
MLNKLEAFLNDMGIEFTRLDGRMSTGERAAAVRDFQTRPACRVFLLSLKVGRCRLN